MKRLNYIFIILLSVNLGFSQSNIEIVNSIAKNNTVECEIVGYSGDESKQYKIYIVNYQIHAIKEIFYS